MPTHTTLLVISTCKFIEAFASSALASLLDIDRENSKTLSNKTSALSFKQKLDLLTDIKAFDKKELPKFKTFTEIRNQFAHNLKVNSFERCFAFLDGTENYLRNLYPEIKGEGKTHEDYLLELYKTLFNDIFKICGEVMEAIENKIGRQIEHKVSKEIYESLIISIKDYAEKNPDFSEFYNQTVEEVTKKYIKE